ncbi:carbohydrate ABC transporter permease [Streptomyces sp. NPDC058228]|uniref:carbohydrate ABC transporter permease n=1 Tax=Streptomyces sp. NPDC058228 TaxID=3346390 RepID=UPI0036E81F88
MAGTLALYAWLVMMALWFVLPILWAVISSFKPRGDIFSYPPKLLPATTTLENYGNLLDGNPFWHWYAMSIIVGLLSTVVSVAVCALAGFGFAKYRFRGKNVLFDVVFSSLAIPLAVIVVPLFILMVKMGLTNPYFALIVPWVAPAFGIFMMRQFIGQAIPDELMEAARLDGCSEFMIFWRVVVPLVRPALGAMAVWSFISAYNSFLWPLIIVNSPNNYTLPLGLNTLFATQNRAYDLVLAGSVLATIPTIVVFVALRRQLIDGLTAGAVKS